LYANKGTRVVVDLEKNGRNKKQLLAVTPVLMQVPKTINRKRVTKSQEEKFKLGIEANQDDP
jgi:hypothetical protein